MTYDNHKHFSDTAKNPSPVRIFTNLPQPGLKLPATKGYRLCVPCNKYVAKQNTHCNTCDSCTSKVHVPPASDATQLHLTARLLSILSKNFPATVLILTSHCFIATTFVATGAYLLQEPIGGPCRQSFIVHVHNIIYCAKKYVVGFC